MKHKFLRRTMIALVLGVLIPFCSMGYAENIDPNDDSSQYAYGENIGWLNFEPMYGPGVTVSDTGLTGYMWAENIGWINLSPTNYGGVTNDGSGNLSGYAWGENVGWINFNPTGGGVTIDANGNFHGWAWGEDIGWIHFQNPSIPYKVQTAWISAQPSLPSMSLPIGPTAIPHDPEDTPVVNIDPHSARPFSFGDISSGTATIRAAFPAFEDPVDIYLAILAEPYGLFLISPYELFELTDIALAVAWRSAQINALEETIDTIPITDLAPGTYWGYTVVVPAGTDPATFDFESSAYYMWYFAVTLP